MTANEISKMVFDAAFKVPQNLGPGLLESALEECLYFELKQTELIIQKQQPLPLVYKPLNLKLGIEYFLIGDKSCSPLCGKIFS